MVQRQFIHLQLAKVNLGTHVFLVTLVQITTLSVRMEIAYAMKTFILKMENAVTIPNFFPIRN